MMNKQIEFKHDGMWVYAATTDGWKTFTEISTAEEGGVYKRTTWEELPLEIQNEIEKRAPIEA